jgi:hypothetical protein
VVLEPFRLCGRRPSLQLEILVLRISLYSKTRELETHPIVDDVAARTSCRMSVTRFCRYGTRFLTSEQDKCHGTDDCSINVSVGL